MKLKLYNEYYTGKNGRLECKEVDGRLVIFGLLRLHWRVNKQIQFKPRDDIPIVETVGNAFRKSYVMAINNGLGTDKSELFLLPVSRF